MNDSKSLVVRQNEAALVVVATVVRTREDCHALVDEVEHVSWWGHLVRSDDVRQHVGSQESIGALLVELTK